jgi:hypothetical protein
MDDNESSPPSVFISYSHDSPEHKRWVGEFASKLVENGIDVILDQWDLGLGDDVPKFMEHGVTRADRVLMICTDSYVRKVDDGKGGVGYEAMIVTGELVRDLGTSKFIPVIRQEPGNTVIPKCVSTRFYINLSAHQNFEEQFESLLRQLHQAPATSKPPLGRNPFAKQPSGSDAPVTIVKESTIPDISKFNNDIVSHYKAALEIARQGDLIAWRKIIQQAKRPIPEQLAVWRAHQEKNPPQKKEDLPLIVLDGANAYAPLLSIVLAGIESGREQFKHHVALIDDILHPNPWNRGGLVALVDFPSTMAFIFQALHGAVCLHTNQLTLAMNLAKARIHRERSNETFPLYQNHDVMGWPPTLDGNCVNGWNFLQKLPETWPWLNEIFGEPTEFQSAIYAYYMALHILEFADTIAAGKESVLQGEKIRLDIPLCFLSVDDDVVRKGYRLLLNDPEQVRKIWIDLSVSESKICELWPIWIKHAKNWFSGTGMFMRRVSMPHQELLKDINII